MFLQHDPMYGHPEKREIADLLIHHSRDMLKVSDAYYHVKSLWKCGP